MTKKVAKTQLSQILHDERLRRGVSSQSKFGEMLKMERGGYGRVERGEVIRPNNWEFIAEFLGMTTHDLNEIINQDAKDAGAFSKIINMDIEPNAHPTPITQKKKPSWQSNMIPINGIAAAGDPDRLVMMDEIVDWAPTPSQLFGVEDGYGVYVHGTSMEPRYFQGELLYLHPHKPITKRDFCVIQIGKESTVPEGAYIKKFISFDNGILKVGQYNPPLVLEFPENEIVSIHLVVGSARA